MAKLTAQSLKDKALRDLNSKKLPQALKKAQLGAKSFPKEADFHGIAGFVLTEMKRYQKAIPYFAEAARLKPQDPQYAENLANTLMQTGRLDCALSYAERMLGTFPGSKELNRVIDEITSKGNNWREIISFVSKQLEKEPDNARQLAMRARAYKHIEFLTEANEDVKRAYELAPDDEYVGLAKASNLAEQGKRSEAVTVLRQILERNPRNTKAILDISDLVRAEDVPDLLALANAIPQDGDLGDEQLDFAKAHLIRKSDGLAASMAYYARANARQHENAPYDFARAEKLFSMTCALFPAGKPLPLATQAGHPVPIFVVGQPRSGTTLMEMMLSASPGIAGCGELQLGADIARPYFEPGQKFSHHDADAYALSFRDMMPPLPEGSTAFVDKMPHNYQRVGFLLSAFPNAKVVNMLRDPRDVGLSKWIRRFPASGMRYASNLQAIAHAANQYRRYITHWQVLFADRILTVRYEDLVADPETHSRRVAEFCDLPWTERMLHPEDNTKQVRTASLHQVRQKISTGAVGGWQAVAEDLQPMLDGFDPDLWPEYDLSC